MHLVQVVVKEGFRDPHAESVLADLKDAGLGTATGVSFVRCYLFGDGIDREAVEEVARRLLADHVMDAFSIDGPAPGEERGGRSLVVARRPGVMDPVALSLADAMRDMGLIPPPIRIGRRYIVRGDVAPDRLLEVAKRVLANEIIEEIREGADFPRTFPRPSRHVLRPDPVPLSGLDDDGLAALSKRRKLSLSVVEMRAVRDHFAAIGRDPTGIEIETIAQTWSEHCKHKTMTGPIRFGDELIGNLLKETVFRATTEIARPDCLSVFKDNAGVIRFDDTRAVCMKVETHNHPSAIEPYGGAGTGIGGVIRDVMGAGLGAWPILNTDVFCFGPPDLPEAELPKGALHPRRIMKGVVAGVRDYGNRMGIPTANGAVYFEERYVGNPLVFCGTVGVMPIDKIEKAPKAGDLVVLAGGRTGRDGIHGVTFASVDLTEESERVDAGAVQIGNPIEERKLLDAQMRARDEGLYRAVTDCGGGGLSSAIGEMGEVLGVAIDLEKAPLKYEGLAPTEIWISESQERMVFAVPPENAERMLAVFAEEGSEAVVIGRFTGDGLLRLSYEGSPVGELSMEFLHRGLPKVERRAEWSPPPREEFARPVRDDYGPSLKAILASPNVASKEWIVRQYDHEVQGLTVVKPFVGVKSDGPGDAVVVTAAPGETRGIVVSNGMNPRYGDLDPWAMAAAAVDEAVRNAVAVGAPPEGLALLDNFAWGNTDRPDRLGALVLASRALYEIAVAYGTPFISGKDSLYNEFQTESGPIRIPHSLLVSAIGVIPDVRRAVTMDLKARGDHLWLLGTTREELGGSHYLMLDGRQGVDPPRVRPAEAVEIFRRLHQAIDAGLVLACHDLSEGGLATAAAEMALAGGLGIGMDLSLVPTNGPFLPDDALLFSESTSRFLVEVRPDREEEFRRLFAGVRAARIGDVNQTGRLLVKGVGGDIVIDEDVEDLRAAFTTPPAGGSR